MPKKSKMLCLNPKLVDGVIRVGGRLRHANLDVDQRMPFVMPNKHAFTKAYVRELHSIHGHCGPQQLLTIARTSNDIGHCENVCKMLSRKAFGERTANGRPANESSSTESTIHQCRL